MLLQVKDQFLHCPSGLWADSEVGLVDPKKYIFMVSLHLKHITLKEALNWRKKKERRY